MFVCRLPTSVAVIMSAQGRDLTVTVEDRFSWYQ
jgi:hypothetical protein